jgi:hypothetical protein
MTAPNLERLDLSDTDTDELFASPSRDNKIPDPADNFNIKQPRETEPSRPNNNTQARQQESRYDSDEARVEMLRKELDGVREVNEVIEGVQASLERAKGNMEVRTDILATSEILRYSSVNDAIYTLVLDCLTYSYVGINASKYLDPHIIPNRT